MASIKTILRRIWRGVSHLSTAQWLWQILAPSWLGALVLAVLAMIAGLPFWAMALLALVAWALAGFGLLCVTAVLKRRAEIAGSNAPPPLTQTFRPLHFDGVIFIWDRRPELECPSLTSVKLQHSNRSALRVRYALHNFWLEVGGRRQTFEPTKSFIVASWGGGGHEFFFQEPIEITAFPLLLRLSYDYHYDTVPSTGERIEGATLSYVLESQHDGARIESSIAEQRDESEPGS